MLGGGIFVTQNKELPGSYINFVSTDSVSNGLVGDRGVVAMAYPLGSSIASGTVIELTASEFISNSQNLLGADYSDDTMLPFREIFRHANKLYVYNTTGVSTTTVASALDALEPYEFNVLAAYTNTKEDIAAYCTKVKSWRDEVGKKCQVVAYNATEQNHEGVVNVVSTVTDDGAPTHALVAWVAGALAGCAVNASCTNMAYDGEYIINCTHTQAQLITQLESGNFVFHRSYDEIRVLEDINTFTEFTAEKGEDFKYNQTIRVLDQIANDIAKIFNTKYLGKIPNDQSGRSSFWGDVVSHHRELETLRAIEDFDAESVTVAQGSTKRSIVVTDAVKPINAMAQLYMTVYVE